MHIRIRLLLMKEIERKNDQNVERWKKQKEKQKRRKNRRRPGRK